MNRYQSIDRELMVVERAAWWNPRSLFKTRNALCAGITISLALMLGATAHAATITVNSLADTGAAGICVLRDAITAANTMTATNGCAAGTGNDTIGFSVTGTISLASTLPQVTDSLLAIKGPASPGITLDGGGQVQVMQVASGAALNLNHLTIANGFANDRGGGIYNAGALALVNSTFSGNFSEFLSGAIHNNLGTLTVINSKFSDNEALDGGGAIFNNVGTLNVINSTFSDNEVRNGVGAGIWTFGTATITNSTFARNSAAFGGGIFNEGASPALTITNCTFAGNGAVQGGGIFNNGGTLTVSSSTFSGNRVGIGDNNEGGVVSMKSSILTHNNPANCSPAGTITDAGYNISDDGSCRFGATGSHGNTDAKLDPGGLSNNGGPTQTIALLPGSPAIDAIPIADCTDQASPPNPIIIDQRLFPRPDAGETNCDIGAYEFQDAAFVAFSHFGGGLRIDPDAGVFYLSGGFKLGAGGSIDPTTQPVAFSVGSYAVRLPAGSFARYNTGYVYQKTISGIFLCVFIKFTSTPGSYVLLANRIGGTLTSTTSPVPVTLTIGDNSGTAQMNAKFD